MNGAITVNMDPWQVILLQALHAHYEHTGHAEFALGRNDINCICCGRHAHIHIGTGMLVVHDVNDRTAGITRPEEF